MSLWDKLRYRYIGVEKLRIEANVEAHVLEVGNSVRLKADDDPTIGHHSQGSIRRMKEKHVWSGQIMEELLQRTCEYDYRQDESLGDKQNQQGNLIGKSGVKEGQKIDSVVSGNKEWSDRSGEENP
ncbi:uncharacterized protein LOC114737260 [Neltuma alba]|uniref:uncharacterized protein LOC114737260 n=1 Tax=Neltuma alba TaxID=207710 RepID=UPI0010A3F935|nr:uncharacterized protein LOC114737260 [Prosopis alba]